MLSYLLCKQGRSKVKPLNFSVDTALERFDEKNNAEPRLKRSYYVQQCLTFLILRKKCLKLLQYKMFSVLKKKNLANLVMVSV
jgi:hypothetical protein